MNTNSEVVRIVSDWLEVRVVDPPHGSLASALALVEQTAQQRRWWHRWIDLGGTGITGDRSRLLVGAAAIIAIVAFLVSVATIGLLPRTLETRLPDVTGTTWSVAAEGGDFTTIGEAVAAAVDGDTILVEAGAYDEALIIDKDITIRSNAERPNQVVLRMPEDAPDPLVVVPQFDPRAGAVAIPERLPIGIQLIDSDATLEDLTVVGQGDGIAMLVSGGSPSIDGVVLNHYGSPVLGMSLAGSLFIEDGSTARIRDATLRYRVRIGGGSAPVISQSRLSSASVLVQDGAAPVFAEVDFHGDCCERHAIVARGASLKLIDSVMNCAAVWVRGHEEDATTAVLEGNRFSSLAAEAVSITDTARATVAGNSFYGNHQGVRVYAASADVRDNDFVSNWNSVMLTDADATVTGNSIRGGEIGISVAQSGSPLITGNTVENVSKLGITATNGTSPTIEGNVICGSAQAFSFAPEAAPVLGDNDICADAAEPGD